MESLQVYKSYNENKSIQELEFNIKQYINSIENFKFDLQFYKALLDKPIFKPHVMNLYENLYKFKNEIKILNINNSDLLNELNSQNHQIRNKIESDNSVCDRFFIKNYDDLELRVLNFKIKIFNFKFRFYQYTESVINK